MGKTTNTPIACRTFTCTQGPVSIQASARGICGIQLGRAVEPYGDAPWLEQAAVEIARYLEGEAVPFAFPLDYGPATAFQQRVWTATRDIPRGETRTYGALAEAAGSPKAARAVGNAMARNPLPVVVPCHRVVGCNGGLGGFGGGLDWKRFLLARDGVKEWIAQ